MLSIIVSLIIGAISCIAGYVLLSGLRSVRDVHRGVDVPGVVDVLPVLGGGLVLAVFGGVDFGFVWLYGCVVGLLDSFTGFSHRVQVALTLPVLVYGLLRFPPTGGVVNVVLYVFVALLAFAAASTANTYAGVNFMESAHVFSLALPLIYYGLVYPGTDTTGASTSLLLVLLAVLPYALTTLPPARSIPSDGYRDAWAMLLLYASLALHVPHLLFLAAIPALLDLGSKLLYGLPKVFVRDSPIFWPRGVLEWVSELGYETQEDALVVVAALDLVAATVAYLLVAVVSVTIVQVAQVSLILAVIGVAVYFWRRQKHKYIDPDSLLR